MASAPYALPAASIHTGHRLKKALVVVATATTIVMAVHLPINRPFRSAHTTALFPPAFFSQRVLTHLAMNHPIAVKGTVISPIPQRKPDVLGMLIYNCVA